MIELLVVIAIIGILASLLLPALSRAKAKAHRATCANNTHQISVGIFMYASDSLGRLPLQSDPSPYPNGEGFFYKELMKSYVGLSGPPAKGDRLFTCPSESRTATDGLPSEVYIEDYSDYEFNSRLRGAALTSIKHPAKTALLIETAAAVGHSWHDPQSHYILVNNPPGAMPHLHAVYNDALNEVAFVDGHLDYIKIYNDGDSISIMYDPPAGYDYQWSND